MPSAPIEVVITGSPSPNANRTFNLIPAPYVNGNTAISFFKISLLMSSTNPVI